MEAFNFSKMHDAINGDKKTCQEHGPYDVVAFRGHISGCPQCMREKQLQDDRDKQKAWDVERRQRIADNLLRRAAIPLRFADRTLEGYQVTDAKQGKALETARDFAGGFDENPGRSLIFCGGVGSGKTHLSVGIAHELIKKEKVCLFSSVIAAVRSVKETYSRDSEITERQALDNLIEPDLLILDEVGVQFGSESEKMILFEIINGRYENMKSTIVISNLAISALTEYLGERVIDRLREGGGKMVIFDWPSFRRNAA